MSLRLQAWYFEDVFHEWHWILRADHYSIDNFFIVVFAWKCWLSESSKLRPFCWFISTLIFMFLHSYRLCLLRQGLFQSCEVAEMQSFNKAFILVQVSEFWRSDVPGMLILSTNFLLQTPFCTKLQAWCFPQGAHTTIQQLRREEKWTRMIFFSKRIPEYFVQIQIFQDFQKVLKVLIYLFNQTH